MDPVSAHRGAILYFVTDPGDGDDPAAFVYHEDGLLVIDRGAWRPSALPQRCCRSYRLPSRRPGMPTH